MSETMLAVERLSAWYGAARILYDLSFEVGRGEVVALMGRNGAGKSTTMKTIMGLMARRQGSAPGRLACFWRMNVHAAAWDLPRKTGAFLSI